MPGVGVPRQVEQFVAGRIGTDHAPEAVRTRQRFGCQRQLAGMAATAVQIGSERLNTC